ncbi:ABC transporter ATP-binding protein [Rheinheimera maricola]|uniref:ABC transporter ATP-binding protein n=1 Tax=Rheinheimera maricola TaxID=2793282 RepID=A0ABS7XF14_9GAMM|nr:ABC transporter ATP-binding protein [Rheinheimera maricola]MBZ9613157.1 ABC transporter ATP-binding protein [Rheinheimera maricola]
MLKLNQVSKEYRNGQVQSVAVNNVSLQINRGELVCLTGKSGSGKSTLLGMLGLINTPSSGEILLNDQHISKLSDSELANIRRQHIGIIFQQFNLHPALTALENVMYPLYLLKDRQAKAKALAALADVGMEEFAERKPKQMSGGQMQRVSIARAFAKKPELIIADEPTANLDSENTAVVYQLLQKLNQDKGVTVVIATHDRNFSSSAVRTLDMHDGQLIQ